MAKTILIKVFTFICINNFEHFKDKIYKTMSQFAPIFSTMYIN